MMRSLSCSVFTSLELGGKEKREGGKVDEFVWGGGWWERGRGEGAMMLSLSCSVFTSLELGSSWKYVWGDALVWCVFVSNEGGDEGGRDSNHNKQLGRIFFGGGGHNQ